LQFKVTLFHLQKIELLRFNELVLGGDVIVHDFAKVNLDFGSKAVVSSGNFLLHDNSRLFASTSDIQVGIVSHLMP